MEDEGRQRQKTGIQSKAQMRNRWRRERFDTFKQGSGMPEYIAIKSLFNVDEFQQLLFSFAHKEI